MNPLAAVPFRTAKLVLPITALLMAVGAGTAAAAPVHAGHPQTHALGAPATPAKAPKFTWHPLTLLNGWKSASTKGLPTGTPAWAVRDGVVYLRGAIRQPNPSGFLTFADLPKSARPPHDLRIQIFTRTEVPAVLYIGSDGDMEVEGGNALATTSLAAVSYPTAAVKSHQLSLKDNWRSSEASYESGNPAYAVSKGVVYLSGSLHGGTSQLAFTLPRAARPAHRMYISVYTNGLSTGWLLIQKSGQVDVDGPGATTFTSLANISFPVASTKWHAFKMIKGWKSAASIYGSAAPGYAVINGVVYLTGSIHHASGGTGLWTIIPKPARPASELQIEVYTFGGTPGEVNMAQNDGFAVSNPPSYAEGQTSLDAIAYPPGS
jgi:hypothetical protein